METILKKCFVFGLLFGLLIPVAGRAAEKSEIVIGQAVATTGKFSTEGADSHRGATLWVEEVNAKGGIFVKNVGKKLPVRFIVYDDKSDASTCAKLYERLMTVDKVDALLPPFGSGNSFAATAVTEKFKYPFILGSAASEKIFERGFNYIFETCILTKTAASVGPNYLSTVKHEIKNVAVLYENFLFTLSLKDFTEKGLRDAGLNISLSEIYPLGCTDFSSIFVKVKAVNPDALILLNLMPASIYATRQMHELGIKPKFYLVNIGPNFRKEFIEGLGELSENICEISYWHWDLPYKGAKEVGKRYEKRFGRMPNSDAIHPYMAGQLLEQAIEKAGTLDREELNKTLHSQEFYTVGGPVKYDKTGVNIYQQGSLVQVQDRKRVNVWPPKLATVKMRFPYRK